LSNSLAFQKEFDYIGGEYRTISCGDAFLLILHYLGGFMKRLLNVLALGFLITACSFAQIGFGIKGGVNLATVGGSDVASFVKSRTGFAVGGYAAVSLPLLFTIQPEVLYGTMGFTTNPHDVPLRQLYSLKETNTYSYIDIPVLVKYSVPLPIIKPSLYVGPEIGILLSARSKLEAPGLVASETDIASTVTSTDFGAVFGASAHLLVADFDVRYTMGLKTIDKTNRAKIYNRVFSILVAVPLF
jgi:hypothetical protein